MRIVSLNTANYDDHPDWDLRRFKICEALFLLEPDVICLQEIRFNPRQPTCQESYQNSAEELLTILQRMGFFTNYRVYTAPAMYYPENFSCPSTEHNVIWEGKALITRLPVNETGNFLLTCQADSRDKNHRSIFWGRISTGSFELICGNLHWSYEPANQMSNASETLDFIDRHIEENLLLIGDFNCTAQEPPLRQLLTGALTDAWQKMNPKQPGFTYPAINPQKRIDLALFNHRLADRILNVSLNGSEKLSDHLALVIDLDLK